MISLQLVLAALRAALHPRIEVKAEVEVTVSPGKATPAPAPAAAPAPVALPQLSEIEVGGRLDRLAVLHLPLRLDWRHSVVDLLKLIGLDSSLEERKRLAIQFGYRGETEVITDNAAALNTWLRAELIRRVRAQGIPLPEA